MLNVKFLDEHFRAAAMNSTRRTIFEIPFGAAANSKEISNGAFVALYSRDHKPYVGYDYAQGKPAEHQSYPAVLMNYRWDHLIGFPGGKVDAGETLQQAAVRELYEENACVVDESKLQPICTHIFKTSVNHYFAANLFGVEVTPEFLLKAQAGSVRAKHYQAEALGSILMRFETVRSGVGMENTLTNHLAPSVLEELDVMMDRMALAAPKELARLRGQMGFIIPEKLGFRAS